MKPYYFMLLEGQKVSFDVHPDAVLTENYCQQDGTTVYVVIGKEEESKLLALQKILDEETN